MINICVRFKEKRSMMKFPASHLKRKYKSVNINALHFFYCYTPIDCPGLCGAPIHLLSVHSWVLTFTDRSTEEKTTHTSSFTFIDHRNPLLFRVTFLSSDQR